MKVADWQKGYHDGYRRKPVAEPSNITYCIGYQAGKSDKDFVDAYSDEALGIHPNEGP